MAEVRFFALRISETEEERLAREYRENNPHGSDAARREANRQRIPSSKCDQPTVYYGDEPCNE